MATSECFQKILPYFPAPLQIPLSRIPAAEAAQIQEIRLRIGRSMHTVLRAAERVVTKQGTLAAEPAAGCTVTRQLLDAVFQNVCAHSVHSCQTAIRQGFLTVAGGSRVGLCGTAVMQGGTLDTVRAVSGMNFRIASERTGCAEKLAMRLGNSISGGVLIAGPPASGKTTILRDLARILGSTQRVCILDERGELAAVQSGIPQFALGAQTDVFDGYPKAIGIAVAVRVMAPEILICDELGAADETDALMQSLHTGVHLIASAHAGSIAQLTARPQIRKLIQAGAFHTAVMLGTGAQCGQVLAVEPLRGGAL